MPLAHPKPHWFQQDKCYNKHYEALKSTKLPFLNQWLIIHFTIAKKNTEDLHALSTYFRQKQLRIMFILIYAMVKDYSNSLE